MILEGFTSLAEHFVEHVSRGHEVVIVVLVVVGVPEEKSLLCRQNCLCDAGIFDAFPVLKYGRFFAVVVVVAVRNLAVDECGCSNYFFASISELNELFTVDGIRTAVVVPILDVFDEPAVDSIGLTPIGDALNNIFDAAGFDFGAWL